MPPLFSIITPVLNGEDTILRCLKSAAAQTCTDYEHIVVDDGSTDQTREIVAKFAEGDSRVRLIAIPHSGVALARKTGMDAAGGELLVRLDADDELLPSYLERVGALFEAHTDADIVSTNGYQVFPDGQRIFYYTDPLFSTVHSLTLPEMLSGHMFGTSAVMRKKVFHLTGGSRPETYSEDPDLWLRAVAMGAKHYHLPEPVFLYHQDQPSSKRITGNTRAIWRSHIEILHYLISSGYLSENEIALAKKRIHALQLRLLLHWDLWGTPLRRTMKRKQHGS